MTSKQFLAFFSIGLAAAAAVIVPFNMHEDVYGLFRTARGRRLSIYGEERVAKYLHSFRYIPENFDGVLLGSSVTDNFDTRRFPGYRIYNASIDGGNVEDLTPIADNVFRRGALKLTILCIHRYLTTELSTAKLAEPQSECKSRLLSTVMYSPVPSGCAALVKNIGWDFKRLLYCRK